MKRINVVFNGTEVTYRTNDNGNYLFKGVSSNTQISCLGGFSSLRRIKRAIRDHIKDQWESAYCEEKMPKIKYIPSQFATWKP